jgi:putative phage-type endonuclease
MFKKVDLKQGSESWLAWRAEGITATAASTIMGVNPYGNVLDLWKDKAGIEDFEFEGSEAAEFGSKTEDKARKEFEKATGLKMHPVCVESLDYPFIKASLDGINEEHSLGLEIKCSFHFGSFNKNKKALIKYLDSKEDHPEFYKGLLKYYYAQIQHQMLVTGYRQWAYWSFFNGSDMLYLVDSDKDFQQELLSRCILFNSLVQNKTAPEDKDFTAYV